MDRLEDILMMTDRAEAYHCLVDLFLSSPEEKREEIRRSWDFGKEWIWPRLRTILCVDQNSRSCYDRIRAALTYYAIADSDIAKVDVEVNFADLCILYHALIEIEQDPVKLFEETAKVASLHMANFIRGFINSNEEDKSMKASGWEKIIDKDGQIFFKNIYFDQPFDIEELLKWGKAGREALATYREMQRRRGEIK